MTTDMGSPIKKVGPPVARGPQSGNLTMKIIRVLYALLLVSIFATPTAAHERANKSGARSHISTRSPVGSQPKAYQIEGREIIPPPLIAASITHHCPHQFADPLWIYGNRSNIQRYRNACCHAGVGHA